MKRSYLIATGMTLAISGWMLAGQFTGDSETAGFDTGAADEQDAADLMTVEVRTHTARPVATHVVAQGHVEPNRMVTVRAETAGRIEAVLSREGERVAADALLIRLEMNDRQARLNKSKALLQERQRAYERAKKLDTQGYQAQRLTDESYSALQAARAELAEIEMEIAHTRVRAPFDGILEKRLVEVGDYVAVNGEIATIVDNNPLRVVVQIPQQEIGRITRESVTEVAFATGQQQSGRVRFIAPRAEEATRSFRVEIEVANPDGALLSGISAEARILTGYTRAQFISPALLTLNTAGEMGVKTVTAAGIVEFHPVNIVLAEAGGVWVSGLPDVSRIITVGQGFVREGEAVNISSARDDSAKQDVLTDLSMQSPVSRTGSPVPQ